MEYISKNERETAALGRKLGESLRGGEIVTLSGDLGAGKTVFAKGIALGLGVSDAVCSPTFTLLNEYEGRLKLYHYDAYRLHTAAEAVEAGLTEFFGERDGVCVLEWWENIASALAAYPKICVRILKKSKNIRKIEIVDE